MSERLSCFISLIWNVSEVDKKKAQMQNFKKEREGMKTELATL